MWLSAPVLAMPLTWGCCVEEGRGYCGFYYQRVLLAQIQYITYFSITRLFISEAPCVSVLRSIFCCRINVPRPLSGALLAAMFAPSMRPAIFQGKWQAIDLCVLFSTSFPVAVVSVCCHGGYLLCQCRNHFLKCCHLVLNFGIGTTEWCIVLGKLSEGVFIFGYCGCKI